MLDAFVLKDCEFHAALPFPRTNGQAANRSLPALPAHAIPPPGKAMLAATILIPCVLQPPPRAASSNELWHLTSRPIWADDTGLFNGGRLIGGLPDSGLAKTFERQNAVKMQGSNRITSILAMLLVASSVAPASAHHSAAPFDMTKNVVVTGTVEKWVWSNPHSWLYIRVAKPGGAQEIWGFEGGSAGMLSRSGWNSGDMKPGDKVTVTGKPSRDGRPVALISEVKLASGKVLGSGFGAPPPGFPPPPGFGPPPAPHK
ncbi:DUF6152 family protein [Novosphingobium sp. FKTRR1]|uniref:DUF6152 family protein n=1 Tax=Novosphingobium sp. FKTRR1 TaxID=2879118 RepID=UPI001CEFC53E|nr:DUF6152 family protein [Novosphingobium sp. FKTRR1]